MNQHVVLEKTFYFDNIVSETILFACDKKNTKSVCLLTKTLLCKHPDFMPKVIWIPIRAFAIALSDNNDCLVP